MMIRPQSSAFMNESAVRVVRERYGLAELPNRIHKLAF